MLVQKEKIKLSNLLQRRSNHRDKLDRDLFFTKNLKKLLIKHLTTFLSLARQGALVEFFTFSKSVTRGAPYLPPCVVCFFMLLCNAFFFLKDQTLLNETELTPNYTILRMQET